MTVKEQLTIWLNTEDDSVIEELNVTLYNPKFMAQYFKDCGYMAEDVVRYATELTMEVVEHYKEYDT